MSLPIHTNFSISLTTEFDAIKKGTARSVNATLLYFACLSINYEMYVFVGFVE